MHDALAVSDDRAGVLARFVEEIDPADAAALAAALREVGSARAATAGRGRDRRRSARRLRLRRGARRTGVDPPLGLAFAGAAAGRGGGGGRRVVGAGRAGAGGHHGVPARERAHRRRRAPDRGVPRTAARGVRHAGGRGDRHRGPGADGRDAVAGGVDGRPVRPPAARGAQAAPAAGAVGGAHVPELRAVVLEQPGRPPSRSADSRADRRRHPRDRRPAQRAGAVAPCSPTNTRTSRRRHHRWLTRPRSWRRRCRSSRC